MRVPSGNRAFAAAELLAALGQAAPDLPVVLRRIHSAGCRPAAVYGTAGELADELRDRHGLVAWGDDRGREWVAFEADVRDREVEIRVRSDVGRFALLGRRIRWE